MNSSPPPIVSDLVLIGGGHSHVHVLKMLGMPRYRQRLWQHGIQVTLIAKDIHTPYSGMLPGYVAGHYTFDEIHLDLQKICRFSNIRLVHASCTQIVPNAKGGGGGMVYCNDGRPPLRYDALSIDIGSASSAVDKTILYYPKIIPVKPIANFCKFYQQLQQRFLCTENKNNNVHRICVVGGGAGGVELILSIQYNLQQMLRKRRKDNSLEMILVTRGATLLEEHNAGAQRILERILKARQIQVYFQSMVVGAVEKDGVSHLKILKAQPSMAEHKNNDDDERTIPFDDCFWCTTAAGATWLSKKTPFECDDKGFLKVDTTYQVPNFPGVFAAGDCASMMDHPRPKAGVFAVRAGPPLLENLMAHLTGKNPVRPYIPQSSFLSIISTGDPYAIASKGRFFCLEGSLIWKWKDWIDRTWMAKYSTELPDIVEMQKQMNFVARRDPKIQPNLQIKSRSVLEAFAGDPMRCGGCGAKVGSTTLSRVLRALHQRQTERAKQRNLPPPPIMDHDDAAILPLPARGGGALVHTIDYLRSLVEDPYLFGKLVAIHSLSDVHAMGATGQSALSLAVVPFAADESITETILLQLLAGVSDVLQDEDPPILLCGGHTSEGAELACGVVAQGYTVDERNLLRKRGGKVGDAIVLTKPIGTGALFAADMRAKCKGEYVQEAVMSMLQSNGPASQVAKSQPSGVIHACTDVTGFGLMGHLLEMLQANDEDSALPSIGARLEIDKIPFLKGGLEAVSQQILSSLQPQNLRMRRAVENHAEAAVKYPTKYPLLFDPQTCGGLLFLVSPDNTDSFIKALVAKGANGSVIGHVTPFEPSTVAGPSLGSSSHHKDDETSMFCTSFGRAGKRVRVI